MVAGASMAGQAARAVAPAGDGGAMLMTSGLAAVAHTDADITSILVNDAGSEGIRSIQGAQCEGRRTYADLVTPDFSLLCRSTELAHEKVSEVEGFAAALDRAPAASGSHVVEVNMAAIYPCAESCAESSVERPAGPAGSLR
jgi:acetolactate synthase-1/2/3 large subunit